MDLPTKGVVFACTAMEIGAPLTMEKDVPFSIGLVELEVGGEAGPNKDGKLRILSRIDAPLSEIAIGDAVELSVFDLPDGRIFYRFRPARVR